MDVAGLQRFRDKQSRETVYLIDVRTREEYEAGHIPGFRWFPGGQAVQRTDDVAVVHNSTVIFSCDGKVRSTSAASWYRQMGLKEVYALEGGANAWLAAGLELEKGMPAELPLGLAEARSKVRFLSPEELNRSMPSQILFVDTSQDFSRGHLPGARWAPRGWLEFQAGDNAPSKEETVVVTATTDSPRCWPGRL